MKLLNATETVRARSRSLLRLTLPLVLAASLPIIQMSLPAQETKASGSAEAVKLVVVAGNGTEPYIQTLIDDTTDFLKSQGIKVKMAEDPSKPRNYQLEHLVGQGQSLIYVTLSLVKGELHDKFAVDCFDVDGKQLWHEEVGSGASFSFTGAVKKMAKSMRQKLAPHIGGPGLQK